MNAEKERIIDEFMQSATMIVLKQKLQLLNLPPTGSKANLQLRLEKAWKTLDLVTVKEHIANNCDFWNQSYDENYGNIANTAEFSSEQELEELERQHKILSMRWEMMQMQKEISNLMREHSTDVNARVNSYGANETETPSTSSSNTCYTIRDIENSVPTFSGDNHFSITTWLKIFEENASLMQWNSKMRLMAAKRLMTGTAKLFLRTVTVSSWNDLKEKLINEFETQMTTADVHNELRNRKKRINETFQQYILSMKEIALLGNIKDGDLIHYIIQGIPDQEQNKIILYGATTLEELKSALRKYETFKQNQNEVNEIHKTNFNQDSAANQMNKNMNMKYYNSTEHGYLNSNWMKPGRQTRIVCFSCGNPNHIRSNCPLRKSIPQKTPTEYSIGDYVMIKNNSNTSGTNGKLYRGPYEIKDILPNNRYIIGDIKGMQISGDPFKGVTCPPNMKLYMYSLDLF